MSDWQDVPGNAGASEFAAVTRILRALEDLPAETRQRVIMSVATLIGIGLGTRQSSPAQGRPVPTGEPPVASFSEDRTLTPKEFLHEKRPTTDVERVACLAFYLAHYRDTPHFKTLDISKLNTEAAQLKFSNAAYAVDNATRAGLLVPATKSAKQLSAVGELYVQALPDRAAARAVVADARPRRSRRSVKSSRTKNDAEQ